MQRLELDPAHLAVGVRPHGRKAVCPRELVAQRGALAPLVKENQEILERLAG